MVSSQGAINRENAKERKSSEIKLQFIQAVAAGTVAGVAVVAGAPIVVPLVTGAYAADQLVAYARNAFDPERNDPYSLKKETFVAQGISWLQERTFG